MEFILATTQTGYPLPESDAVVESDHQDAYASAQVYDYRHVTPYTWAIVVTAHDDSVTYYWATATEDEVYAPEFLVAFKHYLTSSCYPLTQSECEDIMLTPPSYAYGHEDSEKVMQVWVVDLPHAHGVLVAAGAVDSWFCKRQVSFTTPTDDQYHLIWGDKSPQVDMVPLRPNETLWCKAVPGVGLVLGGSDMGGGYDESIVSPPNCTPEEIRAALLALELEHVEAGRRLRITP